jgi:MarR-like DNA-binding transcriptional regulator SgrR of sgrS sRNA
MLAVVPLVSLTDRQPARRIYLLYPCHVPARDMRQHPIGTGPFKLIDFKPRVYVKVGTRGGRRA